ncbi:MAG TPA: DUF4231 domain-containing protein [Oceanobacillus sp.]|nr:DUF4231 domain-containing protein [Oceanobacillus sp.]
MSDNPASPPTKTTTQQMVAQVDEPSTQGKTGFRKSRPAWFRDLPQFPTFKPTEPDPNYQLIDPEKLREVLKGFDEEIIQRIQDDIQFMDYELLRLFRERDHEAKLQQNRYRLFQIFFIGLAAIATMIGSIQALMINNNPAIVPFFAFLETVVALMATFLATISGREAPLPLWLSNRRRAEHLRREYFRFLVNLPPYDSVEGYQRRTLLSKRAAEIADGIDPDTNTGV